MRLAEASGLPERLPGQAIIQVVLSGVPHRACLTP